MKELERARKAEERRLALEAKKEERKLRQEKFKLEKAEAAKAAIINDTERLMDQQSVDPPHKLSEEGPMDKDDEDEENWEGWEESTPQSQPVIEPVEAEEKKESPPALEELFASGKKVEVPDFRAALQARTEQLARQSVADLGAEFDVRTLKIEPKKEEDEEDFFKDMTPTVVQKATGPSKIDLPEKSRQDKARNMFDLAAGDSEVFFSFIYGSCGRK